MNVQNSLFSTTKANMALHSTKNRFAVFVE